MRKYIILCTLMSRLLHTHSVTVILRWRILMQLLFEWMSAYVAQFWIENENIFHGADKNESSSSYEIQKAKRDSLWLFKPSIVIIIIWSRLFRWVCDEYAISKNQRWAFLSPSVREFSIDNDEAKRTINSLAEIQNFTLRNTFGGSNYFD